MFDMPEDWRANCFCELPSCRPCGPALHTAHNFGGCIPPDGRPYDTRRGMLRGVPAGHIKAATKTPVPVVKMFGVIFCSVVLAWTAGWAPPAAGGTAPYDARF